MEVATTRFYAGRCHIHPVGRRGIFDVTVRRDDGTVIAEFRGHSHATSRPLGTEPA
jgi:acyl-CoA thioesterase